MHNAIIATLFAIGLYFSYPIILIVVSRWWSIWKSYPYFAAFSLILTLLSARLDIDWGTSACIQIFGFCAAFYNAALAPALFFVAFGAKKPKRGLCIGLLITIGELAWYFSSPTIFSVFDLK
jgi:hypothetical protein